MKPRGTVRRTLDADDVLTFVSNLLANIGKKAKVQVTLDFSMEEDAPPARGGGGAPPPPSSGSAAPASGAVPDGSVEP